jgi:hypothetical protein
MAVPSVVNSTGGYSGSASTTYSTPGFDNSAGNSIVVIGISINPTTSRYLDNLVDSAGNAYSYVTSFTSDFGDGQYYMVMDMWLCAGIGARTGNVITGTWGGSAQYRVSPQSKSKVCSLVGLRVYPGRERECIFPDSEQPLRTLQGQIV